MYSKPVFCTVVHETSVQYRCTHWLYRGWTQTIKPEQLLNLKKKTTFNDKIDEKSLFPKSLVPPSVWSGGHLIIDRLFEFFLNLDPCSGQVWNVNYSYGRSPGSQQTESELKKVINMTQFWCLVSVSSSPWCVSQQVSIRLSGRREMLPSALLPKYWSYAGATLSLLCSRLLSFTHLIQKS